jgi:hypothetical protein
MSLVSGKLIDNQTHSVSSQRAEAPKLPKEMPLSLKSVCLVFLVVAADKNGVRSGTCMLFAEDY